MFEHANPKGFLERRVNAGSEQSFIGLNPRLVDPRHTGRDK